jgi:N-acyl-D-aspartate/D-glutamate deacylase
VLENDGDDEIGELLADKRTLLGLSDAGAHATQLCDAGYATHLLGHWVRERRALTLEDAVWRLTGHPHRAFRIAQRGLVREGFHADLVAFDAGQVGCTPVERVDDQPGGTDRLVVRSTGVEHQWVNGVATRRDGREVDGAAPGRLLRS